MTKHFCLSLFAIYLAVFGQARHDAQRLEPTQILERELAGGETHTYQITLQAGQFLRVMVEQQGVDVALALVTPDGKQITEVNFTGSSEQESLSHEAAAGGEYRMLISVPAATAPRGAYRVRLEVKGAATAHDKQRIAAERLLGEAFQLSRQGAGGAQQIVEKAPQVAQQWRELGDRYWEAYSLNLTGDAYATLGSYEKAIESYGQVLAIRRQMKDRAGEGSTLRTLGNAYRTLGQHEKAFEHFEQALAIARELKDREGEATALRGLGSACYNLRRGEKAIEYYEQALAIARELKDREGEANALHGLSNGYWVLERYEKDIEYREQALVIYRELKKGDREAGALFGLGNANYYLGRYEKAIEYFEQALIFNRELKDRQQEARVLHHLGASYNSLGRNDKAIGYYEPALIIMREAKNPQGVAFELTCIANVYKQWGGYDKAIEYYEQSLATYREIKDRATEGLTLSNLGNTYRTLGRNEKAIDYYEQGLSIAREVKNRGNETSALLNLGSYHRDLSKYDKANEYYELALVIARELKNRDLEGSTLFDLGIVHQYQGHYDKAIEYSEQALEINREVKNRVHEGHVRLTLGEIYISLKQHQKGVGYLEQALALLHEAKNPSGEAKALYTLAKTERERGNLTRARALIEETLKIVESLRAEIYNQESRVSYFASVQDYNSFYIDLLMRLHKASPSQGFDALAIEASERARARGLLELLTEAGTQIREGVDASLVERERRLALQLNDKARRRMELLGRPHKPEQMATLAAEIRQLETNFEQAQAAIRRASPRYDALIQPQPLSLKEIQQQLDQETLLLEYMLGEDSSYVWAITHDSLTSFELPKQQQIQDAAKHLYNLLTARGTFAKGESPQQKQQRTHQAEAQLPEAARKLSSMLLGPVASQLANRRLIVVADGALQYIPFAMLPSPDSPTAEPLVIAHEITSLPSISALAVQRKELAGRKPAPKMVAVIADPVFSETDERLTAKSRDQKSGPLVQVQREGVERTRIIEHLAGGSVKADSGRQRIPRLPFTGREAAQIISVAQGESNLEARDFRANRATVMSGELKEYRYLHFATHGYLDSERPNFSALLLSMVDEQGKPQDGFLRANEVYNLSLPAELVVLSACQTGLGQDIKGEGLVGITRGFMYAGAARVVVSLWNVNDQATSSLMTKFYEKMLRQGARPAAALRATQVEMWKQKQWQSPYYWAAFTIQGEWR